MERTETGDWNWQRKGAMEKAKRGSLHGFSAVEATEETLLAWIA